MKKRVALLFLSLLIVSMFSFTLISAANETESGELQGFTKAYDCLENLVTDRGYDDLTSEELAFALLALGYDSGMQGELRSALADKSLDNMCWPGDDCSVKETSLAMIALEHVGQSTNAVEEWLAEETIEPRELNWYLQIDTNEESECTISYEGGSRDVDIQEDKRITGAGGQCFRSAFDGYWIKIDEDCFDDQLEITCDKDFITSLVYQKTSGSNTPYYISALTNSAPAQGKTQEKVNSLCFKQEGSTSCDYEGSLWATLALKKLGKDTDAYIPYLISLASNNEKYLPSAFLYMLNGDEEYFTELANKQKADGYWQVTSDSNRRYYDTALALLSLKGRSSEQADKAIEWVLETQPDSGCWRDTRDTSFILYAADPKSPTLSSSRTNCEDSGSFCVSSTETCEEALGESKSNLYCPSLGTSVCCTVDVDEEPPLIDLTLEDEQAECISRGYSCRLSCDGDIEEELFYDCPEIGYSCCSPLTITNDRGNAGMIWLIILLVILIILLALAIIYRSQLKVWFFRVKSKYQKKPLTTQRRPPIQGRPGMPMRPGMPPRRPGMPMRPGMPPRRPGQKPFPKQQELDKTLDKLKKMGK